MQIYPTPRKDKELSKPKLKAAARKINCLEVAKKLHKGTILEAENKYLSPINGGRKELSWLNSRVMEIIRSKITFFRKWKFCPNEKNRKAHKIQPWKSQKVLQEAISF